MLADDLGLDLFDSFRQIQAFHEGGSGPFQGAMTDAQRTFLEGMVAQFDDVHEQAINAFYMEKSGLGIALKNISRMESQLAEFLKTPGPSPKPSDGAQCVADLVHAMPPFGCDSSVSRRIPTLPF